MCNNLTKNCLPPSLPAIMNVKGELEWESLTPTYEDETYEGALWNVFNKYEKRGGSRVAISDFLLNI